jgi:rhodanese-related sulfurtransferase
MLEASNQDLAASYFKAKAAANVSAMMIQGWICEGRSDFVLVDVRIPTEQLTWRIPGSIAIPANQIAVRIKELPCDSLIVLYCWDTWCGLATSAAVHLVDRGYRVKELFGGVAAWETLALPRELTETAGAVPACAC